MFDAQLVRLNNWVTRYRNVRVRPEHVLLLLPHCLQSRKCPQNLLAGLHNCRRCGQCKIKDMLEMAERLGVQCAIAAGGREAVRRATDPSVKVIVAVACERELRQGALAVFPRPVLGVINMRPHGPCTDTDVDLAEVERELRSFLLVPQDESAPSAQPDREKEPSHV